MPCLEILCFAENVGLWLRRRQSFGRYVKESPQSNIFVCSALWEVCFQSLQLVRSTLGHEGGERREELIDISEWQHFVKKKKNLLTGLSVDRHTLFWCWGLSKPNRTSHLNLIQRFVWASMFLCVRVCMAWVGNLTVALLGLVRQCKCVFVLPLACPLLYTWCVGVRDMCLFKQRAGLKTMWTPHHFSSPIPQCFNWVLVVLSSRLPQR